MNQEYATQNTPSSCASLPPLRRTHTISNTRRLHQTHREAGNQHPSQETIANASSATIVALPVASPRTKISRTDDFQARIPFAERQPRPRTSPSAMSQAPPLNITIGYNSSTSGNSRPMLSFSGSSTLMSSPPTLSSPQKIPQYGAHGYSSHSDTGLSMTLGISPRSQSQTHTQILGTSQGGPQGPLIPKGTANSYMYSNQRGYGGKAGYPISDLRTRDELAASRGYFGGFYGSGKFTPKYTPDVPQGTGVSKNRATIGDQPQQYSFKAELARRYHIYNPKKYKNKIKKSTSSASSGADGYGLSASGSSCALPPDMVPILARQIDEAWNRYMLKVEMKAPPQITPLTALCNGENDESDDGYDSEELLYGDHTYDDILGYDEETSKRQEEQLRLLHLGTGDASTSAVEVCTGASGGIDGERGAQGDKNNATSAVNSDGYAVVLHETELVNATQSTLAHDSGNTGNTTSTEHIAPPKECPQTGFVYHPRAPADYRPQGRYDFEVAIPDEGRRPHHLFPHLNDSDYLNSRTVDGKTIRKKKSHNKKYQIDFNKVESIKKRPDPPAPENGENGQIVSGIDVSRANKDSHTSGDSDVTELMKKMDALHQKQMERERMRQQLERQRNPRAIVKSFNDWVNS